MDDLAGVEERSKTIAPYALGKAPEAGKASPFAYDASGFIDDVSTVLDPYAMTGKPEAGASFPNMEQNAMDEKVMETTEATTVMGLPSVLKGIDGASGNVKSNTAPASVPQQDEGREFPLGGARAKHQLIKTENERERTSYPRAISVEIAQNRFFFVNKPVSLEVRVHVNSSIVRKVRAWYVFEPKKEESFFQFAGEISTNRADDNENMLFSVSHEARNAGVIQGHFMFEVTYARVLEYYKLTIKMLSFGGREKPQEIVSKIQRALSGDGAVQLSRRADMADLVWLSNRGMQGHEFIAKLNETSPQYEMLELETTNWRPASGAYDWEVENGQPLDASGEAQDIQRQSPAENGYDNEQTIFVSNRTLLGFDGKCVLKVNRHFFCVVAQSGCRIGRSELEAAHNDFVLLDWKFAHDRSDYPNTTISRQHLEIACVDERVVLKCLSSRSSTFVNDQFIQTDSTIDLQDDNMVQLGQFLLRIRVFRLEDGRVGAVVMYRMDMLPETFILLQHECSLSDVIAGLPGRKRNLKEKWMLQGEKALTLLLPDNRAWPLTPGNSIPFLNGGKIEVLDYNEYKTNPFGRTGM